MIQRSNVVNLFSVRVIENDESSCNEKTDPLPWTVSKYHQHNAELQKEDKVQTITVACTDPGKNEYFCLSQYHLPLPSCWVNYMENVYTS